MRRVLIPLFLLSTLLTHAQVIRTPVTNSYTRAATYSRNNSDVFSFTGNQAALASVQAVSAGAYSERRFMLQELSLYSAVLALPTSSGNFGVKADYFGNVSYNESTVGLAYARKLNDWFDVGVQFNYNNFSVAGYGHSGAVNFDAGVILHMTEQLHTGVHVYNPVGTKFGKTGEEKLPVIYSVGFGYDVSPRFFLGADIEKIEDRPVNINAGMQYNFDQKVLARGGINSSNSTFYFGVGYMFSSFRLDATASIHQQLGFTPGILIIYTAGN